MLIDTVCGFIEVVRRDQQHKYLGNMYPGRLQKRGQTIVSNRVRCAWAKFHEHHATLTNRHVHVRLRLRLFDSVFSPVVLYGLAAAPLKKGDLERVSVTQRKMLRIIVGYAKLIDNDWANMHRQTNEKIDAALAFQPVENRELRVRRSKQVTLQKLQRPSGNLLATKVFLWDPVSTKDEKLIVSPHRCHGRPKARWL